MAIACTQWLASAVNAATVTDPAQGAGVSATIAELPLAFERNQGQTATTVEYVAQGAGYQIFLKPADIVLRLEKHHRRGAKDKNLPPAISSAALDLQFIGANRTARIQHGDPLELKSNYFIGDDPAQYLTDIPNYASVKYESLYPGVDLLLYGNHGHLEYDLALAPHTRPEAIRWRLAGAKALKVSATGDLRASTTVGDVVFHKPVAYQEIDGQRIAVAANYVLDKGRAISVRLGQYDDARPVIIDPVVTYSTFLWGAAAAVATDATGNSYVAGYTQYKDLPTASGYQTTQAGTVDGYVVKLDPTGTKAIYATYLGVRRANSQATAIAVDGAGNAYITGTTNSTSFPVTSGAYRTTSSTLFVTKFNAAGNALAYSTYWPGTAVNGIAVDSGGNLYVAGVGGVTATAGAFQTSGNFYVAKLNTSGSALSYATYLNGAAVRAITIDASGNAYVAGRDTGTISPTSNAYQKVYAGGGDAFVTKLNPTGTGLIYSTFLGGTGDDSANAIAVNAAGEAYVVGQTASDNFPVTSGAFQTRKGYSGSTVTNGFVAKLSASGSALSYSSFLGGNWCSVCYSADYDNDKAMAVVVDAAGYAYVGGRAKSPAFPVVDSIQVTNPGRGDGSGAWPFLAKVTPTGNALVYSTLIGENGLYDKGVLSLALDPLGNLHAIGYNYINDSTTTPTTPGAWLTAGCYSCDVRFLFKLGVPKYTTVITSSANPATASQSITLTANVQGPKGDGGVVTFMDGGTSLGTSQPTAGVATLNVTLAAGVHKITAVYSLDAKTSLPLYQAVDVQTTN
jgi:hypothetical protein